MKKTSSIKLIRTITEMRAFSEAAAKKKKKVGLIPTMGGFHEGHLSLVKAAKRFKKRCDLVVVSIFVNPVQFAPHEDLGQYPRDLEGDMEKLQKLGGVAAVFAPEAVEMFPSGYKAYVEVNDLSRRLCGRNRSGHFRGVATVVMKLFNIIQPQVAFFGEKDYQQALIVKKMVKDLNLQVEIERRPIVRDKDGIALSTRNAYLTEDQRQAALSLRRALEVAEKLIVAGERNASIIVSNMREVIRSQPGADVDYISICHPETLTDLEAVEFKTLIALAVRIGRTRLIDNLLVDLVVLDKKEKLRKAKKAAEAKGPKKAARKKEKQRS
jgi:pantoate--beta-alanine ligase